jgi:hypothetical protein
VILEEVVDFVDRRFSDADHANRDVSLFWQSTIKHLQA